MRPDFEQRLRSHVDWASLYHSYSTAEDVPDLILGLLSPDPKARDDSRSYLQWSLNHQGVQRWESTRESVPFLLELLADPEVKERHLIMPILADFAVGSVDSYYLIHGFHIDEVCTSEGTKEYGYFVFREDKGSATDLAYGKMLRSIYDAVKLGIPLFIQLLNDSSIRLRMFAAHALAWFTDSSGQSVPPLLARLEREKHPKVRASLALALSYVTTFDTTQRKKVIPILNKAWDTRPDDGFVQRMLLIARLRCENPPAKLKAPLLEILRNHPAKRIAYDSYPWSSLDTMGDLLYLAHKYAPHTWHTEIMEATCQGFGNLTNEHDALSIGESLLAYNFTLPPEDQRPKWYDAYRTVELSDLSPLQVRILQTFADTPKAWHFANIQGTLNNYGLPPYLDRLQKFLAGEGDVMRFRYEDERIMPPDFFARLKAVQWRTLRTTAGDAGDIPHLLRALLDDNAAKRSVARQKIYGAFPQHTEVYAVHETLPFLWEILENPTTPERHRLLPLIVDLVIDTVSGRRAWGYLSEYYYLREGFHPDTVYASTGTMHQGFLAFYQTPGSPEDLAHGTRLRGLYEWLTQKLSTLLLWLHDKDAHLRSASAFALAWLPTHAERIVPALLQQLAGEKNAMAHASQLFALYYVTFATPERHAELIPAFITALEKATHPFEKRAALMGLVYFGQDISDTLKKTLREVILDSGKRLKPSDSPWWRLDEPQVYLDILLHRGSEAWHWEIVEVISLLLKALPVVAKTYSNNEKLENDNMLVTLLPPKQAEELADILLKRFFKDLDMDERMGLADGSKPGFSAKNLTPMQRWIMELIVKLDILWDENGYPHLALLGYGFPGYRKDIEAMLNPKRPKSKKQVH